MTLDHMSGAAKSAVDVLSTGIVLAALAELLPHVATLLTIVWMLIRILETDTVRSLIKRDRRASAAPIARDQEPRDGE